MQLVIKDSAVEAKTKKELFKTVKEAGFWFSKFIHEIATTLPGIGVGREIQGSLG